LQELAIEYCVSTFDSDPFEPVPCGVLTIFPFWVSGGPLQSGFLELPYTLAQDFTLYVILRQPNIDIWRRKHDWIAEHGGMVLLNTHPDYMEFHNRTCGLEEYPVRLYREFLEYAKTRYQDRCWAVLPSQVYEFYRSSLPLNGYSSEDVPQYLRQPQARWKSASR
jgi:hypothetical protein